MHTTQGPSGQWYAHYGDYSGAIRASIPVRSQARHPDNHTSASTPHQILGEKGEFVEVEIPFEDVRALYLASVRNRMIAQLEMASDDDLDAMLLGSLLGQQKPPQGPPGWVTEELERRAAITRYISPRPATVVGTGDIYAFHDMTGVLARVDRLPEEGHVLFSVWNPKQPYGWQEGAGLKSHEEFLTLYPRRYLGPEPEAQSMP